MGGLGGRGSAARLGYAGTVLLANTPWRSSWAAGACFRRQLFVVVVAAVHATEQQRRRQRLVAVVAAAVRHQGARVGCEDQVCHSDTD